LNLLNIPIRNSHFNEANNKPLPSVTNLLIQDSKTIY